MYWADKIAKEIISSKKFKPYWVDDMKTPSGFAHVGSLRGPIIHSLIFRALKDAGVEVKFTFVINDFDHADELPPEFKDELKNYMGFPLRKIPSPSKGYDSLGMLLADDFNKVMSELGVEAEILSSWDMYHQGKFDGVIKEALDAGEKIQDLYQKISGSRKKEAGWLPFQVICEECGRLGTTRVYDWDREKVSYKCEPSLVTWSEGCGNEGKISPFGGTGKLPWKVDWAAHWKVIGVTVEAAGKDHASAGGSYDLALTLCDEVFNWPKPFNFGYEFFLIGGRKMSSSKGLGLKAHDLINVLPAELGRFLFARSDYREQINFDPVGTMAIPDLFDEYDRCWLAYIEGTNENLARVFELSLIKGVPDEKPIFLPRFRDVANYLEQPNVDLVKKFEELKGSELTPVELKLLNQREKYAKIWIKKYAPQELKYEMLDELPRGLKLGDKEKEFLEKVVDLVEEKKDAEDLQQAIYNLTKEIKLDTKEAFTALYQVLIGKDHGPKAAWFLLSLPKKKVIQRLNEAVGVKS
ncbi:lysine--tRNA ligase [Candidatus Woesebacteria bacterium RBG_19FT_COMBO_42_9]|nr:MAG: lysine--tRNA ligase [Candidatus Woesebacteria bacterium RBG_19FT_COMBO_42_9]